VALLEEFIELGRNIILFDRVTAYGTDYKHVSQGPAVSHAQPGFIGHDYKGVVVLGQNPGEGNFGTWEKDNRELEALLGAWLDSRGQAAYDRAFAFFVRSFDNSPAWRDWTGSILTSGRLSIENIAVLNLVKMATKKNRLPTSRMFDEDWKWTKDQLELLAPKIVVAGGKAVHRELGRLWPVQPFQLLLQNRARAIPGLRFDQLQRRRADEVETIGTAIRAALAQP
jgi:hypothetical protein